MFTHEHEHYRQDTQKGGNLTIESKWKLLSPLLNHWNYPYILLDAAFKMNFDNTKLYK